VIQQLKESELANQMRIAFTSDKPNLPDKLMKFTPNQKILTVQLQNKA